MCAASIHFDTKRYKDKISGLLREIENQFQLFSEPETEFTVFGSPFTVRASDLPVDMQLEIIDLQCDVELKDKFASMGLDAFYKYLLQVPPRSKFTHKHLNEILELAVSQDMMPHIHALVQGKRCRFRGKY